MPETAVPPTADTADTAHAADTADPVVELSGIRFRRGDRDLLSDVNFRLGAGERWVLLGPNGAGKTTLIRVAALFEFPTEGRIDILGHRAGRVDLRQLRPRIGFNSPALTDLLRPQLTPLDIVTSALHGSLVPWWSRATDADRALAAEQLDRVGCAALAGQAYGTLSSGERQRVLLARTLVTEPALLLLDEPGAALDLVGREQLIETLDRIAAEPGSPPMVLVTHHVEEIPASFTHGLLLRDGRVVFAGPLPEAMAPERISQCFGMALDITRHEGRWVARRASGGASPAARAT
ncbi:MAG: ABC transporter ATP-binding protein [Acidimicrobiales bacterium]